MEMQSHIPAIAAIIAEEMARFPTETNANALRCAAVFVNEDFPAATSADFGDAAASLGMHRQAAMNRWNEAKANWGDDWNNA
jgi:hypothetical protein